MFSRLDWGSFFTGSWFRPLARLGKVKKTWLWLWSVKEGEKRGNEGFQSERGEGVRDRLQHMLALRWRERSYRMNRRARERVGLNTVQLPKGAQQEWNAHSQQFRSIQGYYCLLQWRWALISLELTLFLTYQCSSECTFYWGGDLGIQTSSAWIFLKVAPTSWMRQVNANKEMKRKATLFPETTA